MSGSSVAGGFLAAVGCWLGLTALRADDRRWCRLTLNWPVPWSQLSARSRRTTRAVCGLLALLLLGGGLALALRPV
ncbi:MAG: hypothetical protein IT204_09585 [Fimbriimonadaceae bacterium]|nr:hypothetical protein [Fimbriimonadaceae bacterium]